MPLRFIQRAMARGWRYYDATQLSADITIFMPRYAAAAAADIFAARADVTTLKSTNRMTLSSYARFRCRAMPLRRRFFAHTAMFSR